MVMKRSIIPVAVLLAVVVLAFQSCKKEEKTKQKEETQMPYQCTSCPTKPEALAEYDATSKGIYKGTVIGSSGTIKFSVQNGGNDIVATLIIDGTTANLTSSVNWISGQAYVAPFTGTINGQPASITFSVNADGSNPVITSSDIPGHSNAVFTLVKETSNALIECFEGTYESTKPESGTFNIILSRTLGKWGGIARKSSGGNQSDINGIIDNGTIKDEDNKTIGSLKGDVITGSFQDNNGSTITISGKRTL